MVQGQLCLSCGCQRRVATACPCCMCTHGGGVRGGGWSYEGGEEDYERRRSSTGTEGLQRTASQ
eukprot:3781983-Pyramimonas_sp.AAC.1